MKREFFFKKFYTIAVCAALIAPISYTGAAMQKGQDAAKAAEYFQNELNYIASPYEVKKLLDEKKQIIIVDVRSVEKFNEGHIPGAINIPYEELEKVADENRRFPAMRHLKKDEINYVYCSESLCQLSTHAAQKLALMGFPVKEIRGGFKTWQEKGFSVEK